MTPKKPGQYWTPAEAEKLVAWWNADANRPQAELTADHRRYLESANLANHNDEARPFMLGEQLGTFLLVAEMVRDLESGGLPSGGIFKASEETRWCEVLVPGALQRLGLDLPYHVTESVDGLLVKRAPPA